MFSPAENYAEAIAVSAGSGIASDPEAQLTVPLHNFLVAFATDAGIGDLTLLREAHLDGIKPDFAAMIDGNACGWIELKAPGHSLDGSTWRGREARQWELLSALDSLVVTDGQQAVLYRVGERIGEARLPYTGLDNWDPDELSVVLRLFANARPQPIRRVSQLSARLAPLAALLRQRISSGLLPETPVAAVREAKNAWSTYVHENVSDSGFANDLAQVISYALAIAALRGGADRDGDHLISLSEAQDSLRGPNDVLAAALAPALEIRGLLSALAPEVAAIERLASAVDSEAVRRSVDSRGEPWLWFYEDFLAKYDPQARREAGVYYTPVDVVECQVRLAHQILSGEFAKPLSFGDPTVVTLDPAAGSGTYPLAVLNLAADVAVEERGPAGPQTIAHSLADNLLAFEILPGPYSVTHLRVGQRLADLAGTLTPPEHVRVYLTDTLEDPTATVPTLSLWGDPAVLAEERAKAAAVKGTEPVTVIVGNPPYARRTARSGGGWVVHPGSGRALFADVMEGAQEASVIFSAQASLYNDYVYFWRWAIWKAFEQDRDRAAVVSFITASSWLTGPAFVGLRRLARQLADEMWIVDLGGEGRGSLQEENVFAIQTPVAIVTLYRRGTKERGAPPAEVSYRRETGTRSEKLEALRRIQSPLVDRSGWTIVDVADGEVPLPPVGDDSWRALPLLTDLMPWQQPGCKFNRAWPISPSRSVLGRRWRELLDTPSNDVRTERFVTGSSGRTIFTRVGDLVPLLATFASWCDTPSWVHGLVG